MVNQAMKAAHADVLGREVERPNLRRHRRGQSKRDIGGQRAMFTQRHGRVLYRGATRSRATQVMPGHPLGGFWDRWIDATRSSRPTVRTLAHRKLAGMATYPVIGELAGADL